jgi:SanA protein
MFVLIIGTSVVICNVWIVRSARGRMFDQVADVPARRVGLVLGTGRTARDGRLNPHFRNRMEAAAELYRAKKVRQLIVSGDNHVKGYDEPTDMKLALLALGVPEPAMTLDYAGFRTLDSVVRAQKVFGQSAFVIVSGRFHNHRALFVCRYYGIDAVAFNAREVALRYAVRTNVREWFARVKAVVDLYVLHARPKFLGQPVAIPVT